jgi:glycosyltransferase involved in cell wall biosynthesis
MKVAVLGWSNRVAGGVQEYLRTFLAAAADSGNEFGFWYETTAGGPDRATIPDPPAGGWSIAELGRARALAALRRWQPDVIYAHGLSSPELELEAYGIAPTVYFAHGYAGTCITGAKTTWLPAPKPCNRRFGPACLAHYFPHRCGGLNPRTMLRQYLLQARRLAIIRKCAAVVTHSEHMRDEFVRNGIPSDRVFTNPHLVPVVEAVPEDVATRSLPERPTLLFLGRMEAGKGGRMLLDALPRVRDALARPLRIVFAGDGAERSSLERRAASLHAADAQLRIEFTGWVETERRSALFKEVDLLVVPSIWPEPFGLVGPEAGSYGVPAAAFAVGGTASWLTDGVNGSLAAGDRPTSAGLAEAIVGCLADPVTHRRLRTGAVRLAGRYTWDNHFSGLMAVLSRFARDGSQAGSGGALDELVFRAELSHPGLPD